MKTVDDICRLLQPGMRVFVHAGPAESIALRAALQRNPQCAENVIFVGAFIPGLNDFDYAALTPTTHVTSIFLPPSSRQSHEAGRHQNLPIHYSAFGDYLRVRPVDLAILHVPSHKIDTFSMGLNADFAPIAAKTATSVALLVNEKLPSTYGHHGLRLTNIDHIAEAESALLPAAADAADPFAATIAQHAAALIDDGATFEIGLGKVPSAILDALADRKRLKVHSGMITDAVARLWFGGAMDFSDSARHRVGMAVGGELVHRMAADPRLQFCDVETTHDPRVIAAIDNFVAINSAIEVDLFGQVNGEMVKNRQISGIGGATDFARAARLSLNGRSIIALPATAGARSRIVPCLASGPISQPRSDADMVITEHGIANLRFLDPHERAEALIAIADPAHRSLLREEWAMISQRI